MFLLCGADDQPAISQGVADLYLALRRAGVSAELHIYAGVGHGFGLRQTTPVRLQPGRSSFCSGSACSDSRNVGKRADSRYAAEKTAGPRTAPPDFSSGGLDQNLKATSRRYDRP